MAAGDDDVDMESLQVQIDMSMAFAHDLVTSWIKPTHLAQVKSTSVNATQILEEELRRPPRLGVGASVPTVSPVAHEASRLKRRLGKTERKHKCVMESQPQGSSESDDEELKGRPIKRKMKADPFSHEGSKKRNAKSTAHPYSPAENVSQPPVSLLQSSASGEMAKCDSSCRQEKQQIRPEDQQSHATEGWRLMSSPPVTSPVQTTFRPNPTVPIRTSLLEPSRKTSAPVPGKPIPPETSRMHTNYMSVPDKAKGHGVQLLNLDGPPALIDKPGDKSEMSYSRKKRKRRKKKNHALAGTGDD